MARVTKIINVCDRCAFGRAKEVQQKRVFAEDGLAYELHLCDDHATQYDRERMGWIRLAKEVELPLGWRAKSPSRNFSETDKERDRRAAELRARQQPERAPAPEPAAPVAEPEPESPLARVLQLSTQVSPGERHPNGWLLTPHAAERAELRGYSIEEVMYAAVRPEISYVGNDGRKRIHQAGECAVAVDTDEKVVVTVLHRDEAKYALDHLHDAKERIAQ